MSLLPCFGARAAILARDWVAERGWPEHRCTTLADAICLHLNVAVPRQHGPEAQLLQAGAGLDVIGLRHWQLAPETVASVLARYPRHDMKKVAYPLFAAAAHLEPMSVRCDASLHVGEGHARVEQIAHLVHEDGLPLPQRQLDHARLKSEPKP